jgi:hypothetical protein
MNYICNNFIFTAVNNIFLKSIVFRNVVKKISSPPNRSKFTLHYWTWPMHEKIGSWLLVVTKSCDQENYPSRLLVTSVKTPWASMEVRIWIQKTNPKSEGWHFLRHCRQHHNLRGTSHYGHRVERTLDKLSSRGQGRSPLKYTNYRFCIILDRKVCLLEESLGFHI